MHSAVVLVTLTYLGFPEGAQQAQGSRFYSCQSLSGVAAPPTPPLVTCSPRHPAPALSYCLVIEVAAEKLPSPQSSLLALLGEATRDTGPRSDSFLGPPLHLLLHLSSELKISLEPPWYPHPSHSSGPSCCLTSTFKDNFAIPACGWGTSLFPRL